MGIAAGCRQGKIQTQTQTARPPFSLKGGRGANGACRSYEAGSPRFERATALPAAAPQHALTPPTCA
eukprot:358963-Chlamydomonas_euryale.AAC.3